MSFSDQAEVRVANALAGTAAADFGTLREVSLHTADPGETDTPLGEVSTAGTGYARTAATFAVVTPAENPARVANDAVVQFPPVTTDWGVITHIVVWDATNSLPLWVHELTTPINVTAGGSFSFPVGNLDVTVECPVST